MKGRREGEGWRGFGSSGATEARTGNSEWEEWEGRQQGQDRRGRSDGATRAKPNQDIARHNNKRDQVRGDWVLVRVYSQVLVEVRYRYQWMHTTKYSTTDDDGDLGGGGTLWLRTGKILLWASLQ